MKKILIVLVVILFLIVGALFVVPPIIGNSLVKSRIIEAVKEATGRDLQIADLSLAVLPSVSVSITGLRLANAVESYAVYALKSVWPSGLAANN